METQLVAIAINGTTLLVINLLIQSRHDTLSICEGTRIKGRVQGIRPIIMSAEHARTPFFTCEEQKIILMHYEEEKANLNERSNTVAASRRSQMAWQRIANCING